MGKSLKFHLLDLLTVCCSELLDNIMIYFYKVAVLVSLFFGYGIYTDTFRKKERSENML